MDILIASDIFGHTPALDRLVARLRADQVCILSPHEQCFTDEARAYDHFTRTTDLTAYAQKISDHLNSRGPKNPDLVLIGFSVGAAAVWLVSACPDFAWIQRAFCFYGSRIRDQQSVCPVFPVDLIFPAQEPGFDVKALARELSCVPLVSCIREESGGHGFMNEASRNFSLPLYQAWTRRLNQSLEPGPGQRTGGL